MITLEAPIAAVTVYTSRARVTRRGSIRLPPGEHTLVIAGLPTTLEPDSVRVSGRGAHIKILGVDVATAFIVQPPEALIAELQAQLEALQDADRALADEDAGQAGQLEFLKTLRESSGTNLAKGIAFGKTELDRVGAVAQFLTTGQATLQARRREIAQQRRDLAREMEAVRRRLEQVQHPDAQERRDIRIAVEASAESELEAEVSYSVWGAAWEPVYDLRLVEHAVALTYFGLITQHTGEDWPAVELSLSTARPAVSPTIPELSPWYLDIPRPQPVPLPRQALPKRMAADRLAAEPMLAAGAQEAEPAMPPAAPAAQVAAAEIERAGAAVTYRVARPVAVPSDGSPHKTLVTTLDFEARLDYISVPRLAEEAYLRAKVRNSSAFTLLPGKVAIFHAADFVGNTRFETIAPEEEFEVQLGIDDRLKVERELTRRAVDKTLIGNTRRIGFAYRIKLTNLLAEPAHITLFDQLPVARHESIKIKLQDAQPRPAEQSDLNVLKWELDLAPQHKQEVSFAFTVEHPREAVVVGLE